MIRVTIKHEDDNGREYGYGLYVNGYVSDTEFMVDGAGGDMGLYATKCLRKGADEDVIKRAERTVRKTARRKYLAEKRRMG